jgi:TIGR03009 family protein
MRGNGTFKTLCRSIALVAMSGVASAQAPNNAPRSKNAPAPVQAQARPTPPNPADVQKMEELLKEWEKHSAKITSLSTKCTRFDSLVVVNDSVEYLGEAFLMFPDRAYLNFCEVDSKTKKIAPITERILCTGEEVLLYRASTKQIFVYPLPKNQQQKAFQQGPLPFLFNFNVADAKRRYHFELMPIAQPDVHCIRIIPLAGEDREAFSEALILLNKTRFLPQAIKLISPNGKDFQLYKFPNIEVNGSIDPSKFVPVKFQGWQVVNNPSPGAQPAGGGPAEGRGAPAAGVAGRGQAGANAGGRAPR